MVASYEKRRQVFRNGWDTSHIPKSVPRRYGISRSYVAYLKARVLAVVSFCSSHYVLPTAVLIAGYYYVMPSGILPVH